MRGNPISKTYLIREYVRRKKSVAEIADQLKCSENKVTYWLKGYLIQKRSISDALYTKHNPNGDPFKFKKPSTPEEWFLFGLGLGLYWGEGNKKNKMAVRLGNSDPRLIKKFLEFLYTTYAVEEHKVRFGLQIFNDMNPQKVLSFWCEQLHVGKEKFGKVIVTKSRGIGTYREKTNYGVLTIYVSNTKLRNMICSEIEKLK